MSQIKLVAFDFDGVFTDNTVYVSESGQEMVRCWRGDGLGLQKLKKLGIEIVVISTESNPVVKARCAKLGLNCVCNSGNKLNALHKFVDGRFKKSEIAFVGNDINDIECLKAVGMPIIVKDAHADVRSQLSDTPNLHVTNTVGGQGAVREVCDFLAKEHEGCR